MRRAYAIYFLSISQAHLHLTHVISSQRSLPTIRQADIFTKLYHLNSLKGFEPDDLAPSVLKHCTIFWLQFSLHFSTNLRPQRSSLMLPRKDILFPFLNQLILPLFWTSGIQQLFFLLWSRFPRDLLWINSFLSSDIFFRIRNMVSLKGGQPTPTQHFFSLTCYRCMVNTARWMSCIWSMPRRSID